MRDLEKRLMKLETKHARLSLKVEHNVSLKSQQVADMIRKDS